MVDHVLDTILVQLSIFETYDSISDHETKQVDLSDSLFSVMCIDSNRQIGNILTGIWLSGNPEWVLGVLGVVLEKVEQGRKVVIGSVQVIVLVVGILVGGVAHTGGGLKEEEIGYFVPGVRVGGQFITDLVVHAILKKVRAYLLYKAKQRRAPGSTIHP